jgi:hypothetical protein
MYELRYDPDTYEDLKRLKDMRPERQEVKIQSEELPVLPMFFPLIVTIFREGVSGVKGDTNPRSGMTWNVAQWDVR